MELELCREEPNTSLGQSDNAKRYALITDYVWVPASSQLPFLVGFEVMCGPWRKKKKRTKTSNAGGKKIEHRKG